MIDQRHAAKVEQAARDAIAIVLETGAGGMTNFVNLDGVIFSVSVRRTVMRKPTENAQDAHQGTEAPKDGD